MFDYKTIAQVTMNFEKISETELIAKDVVTGLEVGKVILNGCTFDASSDEVFVQYKLWCTRPERTVGKKIDIAGKNIEELATAYEELFIGAFLLTQPDRYKDKFSSAIDWLRTTDFYTAPASTRYHESFPGGLLIHSLNVYNRMVELIQSDAFKMVSVAEATLVCLVHDWCKIALYEPYQKNVKNEKTGQWEKETAYKSNQKGVPLGHGVSSMYLASKVMHLSVEQCLAIRWHMSHWRVADDEINELQLANESYPMVHLIQFADQLAIVNY